MYDQLALDPVIPAKNGMRSRDSITSGPVTMIDSHGGRDENSAERAALRPIVSVSAVETERQYVPRGRKRR